MPISNKTETQVKIIDFNIRGRSAIQTEFQDDSKFLTIAPALPVLPKTLTPLKLSKRSYDSLSSVGSSFNFESNGVESSNAVTLQWTGEGKTVSAMRTPAEREKNPDRISLDRRGLTIFPNIIGESKLRLISLQHNLLTKIDGCNFEQLNKLVFLDLYDNQIEKICSLECLENLRVLLMGKNRIKKIEGLMQLNKIEVLDLHSNQIQLITGLNSLTSLKVLNLAGNIIKTIECNDLRNLTSLKELNLKRNRIKKLLGFDNIPQLQKLYLSNNDIYKMEDMGNVVKAFHIKEISIDGNPITLNSDYISFLVSYLPNLQTLSSMQITEQVRRTAIAWRTAKEQVNSDFLDLSTQVCMNVQREEIISNAKTNWEFLRSKRKLTTKDNKMNNYKINNSNNTNNKINIIRPRNLSKAKLKGFGSLTSINEKVEATKIQINKRSNSIDCLHKFEDASKTYSLEFKLPPILNSIIDNLMNNKFNENLVKLGNSLGTLNDVTSSTNSETESSESHESLKSGLRSHLIHPSKRTVSIDSDKHSRHVKIDLKKDEDLSSISKTLTSITNHITEPLVYKNHKTAVQFIDNNEKSNIKEDSSTTLYHIDKIFDVNISNDCETIQAKSNNNNVKYYSINSKINSLDSSKSSLSDSSSSSLNKNITHKNYDFEKDKHRARSAHVKKIVYYKSNRAATARVKYRAMISTSPVPQPILPREREQGSDYLIEIIGRCLNVFGQGSLRFIDRSWDTLKAEDVNVVKFNYVQFNSISLILYKLKNRFPKVEHFLFKETNISYLGQINALTEVQGLKSIRIEAEGNPIISKNWRPYAIFRLVHWGLHTINGKEITEEEIEHANKEYAGLLDILIPSLPDSSLQPVLQRLGLEEKILKENREQITAKQFLFNTHPVLRSVVGKEALQWRKESVTQEDLIRRHNGKMQLLNLIDLTVDAIEKLQILENEWPNILNKIIYQALSDFSDMNTYMKKCSQMLDDIDKLFINNT